MINKIGAVLIMLCVSCELFAEGECMIVELNNGEEISFLLKEKPVITCKDASLVVNGSAETSYAIEDVKNYHFSKTVLSGLRTATNSISVAYINDQTIELQNAHPMSLVSLSSISGVKIFSAFVGDEGKLSINLPSRQGVYVLSVGNQSLKIIRK